MEIGLLSDPGCVRSRNEDSIRFVRPRTASERKRGALAIVADGMGGHQAGDRASQLAVELIAKAYYAASARTPQEALRQAFTAANRAIFQEASRDPALAGMGTTATALAILDHGVHYAHVGDSRLYRLRGRDLAQLSEDHTLVMALMRDGLLTQEQAREHPDRHVITRAMGSHPSVEVMVSARSLPIQAGDAFILCTDGLHDLVQAEDIRQGLAGRSPSEACRYLVDLAKERGGHDNISVIVLRCQEADGVAADTAPVTRSGEVVDNA